jgi:hypothetical protein
VCGASAVIVLSQAFNVMLSMFKLTYFRRMIRVRVQRLRLSSPSIRGLPLFALLLLVVPSTVLANDGWQYRLTPYLWFAGLKGSVATIPGSPAAPIEVSPNEAIGDTEASLMLLFDAKHGRHGVFSDLVYSDVRSDAELLPAPIGLTLHSISKTTIFSLAYQYEIFNQGRAVVDVMLGARYWNIDTELHFGQGVGLLAGRKLAHDESWIDPAIGIKGRMPLGNSSFYVDGGAGLGGFGVGSDLFYDINGAIGYQWNKAIGTALGYRMFDVDYGDDGFVYNARQQGWQLGLTWAF